VKSGKPRVIGHFTVLDGIMIWELSGDDDPGSLINGQLPFYMALGFNSYLL
jgi:hypothetical protein